MSYRDCGDVAERVETVMPGGNVQLARDFCAGFLHPTWIGCFDTADFFFVFGNRGRDFYSEMSEWVEENCQGRELDSVVDDDGWTIVVCKYGADCQEENDFVRLEAKCREYIRQLCSGAYPAIQLQSVGLYGPPTVA